MESKGKFIYNEEVDAPILKNFHYLNQRDVNKYYGLCGEWLLFSLLRLCLTNFDNWLGFNYKRLFKGD